MSVRKSFELAYPSVYSNAVYEEFECVGITKQKRISVVFPTLQAFFQALEIRRETRHIR